MSDLRCPRCKLGVLLPGPDDKKRLQRDMMRIVDLEIEVRQLRIDLERALKVKSKLAYEKREEARVRQSP